MEYKESDMLLEDDNEGGNDAELASTLLEIEEEELETELALDALNKKSKAPPVRFSLAQRRRIEEIHEERRLREEFDYDEGEFEAEASKSNDVIKSE